MADIGVWPERTLVIALRVKSTMAAICARSEQLIHIILDKKKEHHGVCRWFSRYSRFNCMAREKFKHFIVCKIQHGRHLTR